MRDTSLRLPPGDFARSSRCASSTATAWKGRARAADRARGSGNVWPVTGTTNSNILERNIYARLKSMILGKTAVKGPKGIKAGSEITEEPLETLSRGQYWQLALGDEKDAAEVEALNKQFEVQKRALDHRFEDKVEKVRRGDDLPPGVMKMVKSFIAVSASSSRATRWPAVTATRA